MNNLPEDFVFSQSNLQDYIDCPRRFQLKYFERVRWPAPEAEPMDEHEAHMQQGALFHHFVHQHVLGIPAELITRQIKDETLREWWETYLAWDWSGVPERREPEITLSMPLGEWRLMAKYDVLAVDPDKKAVIIDWKTTRTMSKREHIERRMQTLVYRYVLAKSGEDRNNEHPILPETIHMIYWYPSQQGQSIAFDYSQAQLEADEETLLQLVNDINQRESFPLTDDLWKCKFCAYRSLCDRGRKAGTLDELEEFVSGDTPYDDFDIDLDQIAEVEF